MKSKIELMNIVAITSDDVVTVKVNFSNQPKGTNYIYLCPRVLAETLKEKDKVLVEANQVISVASVVELETSCNLPNIDKTIYKWLFGKVSIESLEEIKSWQKEVAETLHSKQIQRMQKVVLSELGISDTTKDIPQLKLTTNTET